MCRTSNQSMVVSVSRYLPVYFGPRRLIVVTGHRARPGSIGQQTRATQMIHRHVAGRGIARTTGGPVLRRQVAEGVVSEGGRHAVHCLTHSLAEPVIEVARRDIACSCYDCSADGAVFGVVGEVAALAAGDGDRDDVAVVVVGPCVDLVFASCRRSIAVFRLIAAAGRCSQSPSGFQGYRIGSSGSIRCRSRPRSSTGSDCRSHMSA